MILGWKWVGRRRSVRCGGRDEGQRVVDSGYSMFVRDPMWPGGAMAGPSMHPCSSYDPFMHNMHYGMQPFPMDPTSAAAANAAAPTAPMDSMMEQQQRMMRQQQQQQQQQAAASRRVGAQPSAAEAASMAAYHNIPMGANTVPGQTRPLMRYPSASAMYPNNPAAAAQLQQQQQTSMRSPAYPAPHQMIRAGPPMLYGNLQSNVQQQQVISYPNPNMMPPVNYHGGPENGHIAVPERILLNETLDKPSMKLEFEVTPDILAYMQSSPTDILITVFIPNMAQCAPEDQKAPMKISVNGRQPFDMTGAIKTQAIRPYVVGGKNSLQIAYHARFSLHRITVELISRRYFAQVTQHLLQTSENNLPTSRNRVLSIANTLGGSVRVPLICSFSKRRMSTPARHSTCNAFSWFDLNTFLTAHANTTKYFCQLCNTWFTLRDIEVDFYIGSLLTEYRNMPQLKEILLDKSGAHRPVDSMQMEGFGGQQPQPTPANQKKRQLQEDVANPIKRIKSETFATFAKQQDPFSMERTHDDHFANMPMPGSVPNCMNYDALPKMMSPFQGMGSPNKPTTNVNPSTPASLGNNPPSVGSTSAAHQILSSTSPRHGIHPQEQPASLAGSAPYTPASVGMSTSSSAPSCEGGKYHDGNLSSSSLNIDVVELYSTGDTSLVDNFEIIKKYLNDTSLTNFDDVQVNDEGYNPPWEDIQSLISGK
ncbi:unnamed protein product [Caenorhabditis auriculariae]|uniref:SP-RING-type domain-containing protein n=1 Tax=Caenorhabditis auriculariae TaxID=2777116 RepID=A0A8S1H839_9PELO|nr:unnamed protein product [Caenorhabditis auriculariae]